MLPYIRTSVLGSSDSDSLDSVTLLRAPDASRWAPDTSPPFTVSPEPTIVPVRHTCMFAPVCSGFPSVHAPVARPSMWSLCWFSVFDLSRCPCHRLPPRVARAAWRRGVRQRPALAVCKRVLPQPPQAKAIDEQISLSRSTYQKLRESTFRILPCWTCEAFLLKGKCCDV